MRGIAGDRGSPRAVRLHNQSATDPAIGTGGAHRSFAHALVVQAACQAHTKAQCPDWPALIAMAAGNLKVAARAVCATRLGIVYVPPNCLALHQVCTRVL